jgi:hypothetical protein
MDYKGGTELWKHQWGEIQDPDGVWFDFWQDEEDGESFRKAKLSGIYYGDSLLAHNQTLYFLPIVAESVTMHAKRGQKSDEKQMEVLWLLNGERSESDSITFVANDALFGDKLQVDVTANDEVWLGKDSIVNIHIEKIEVDMETIIDSLMRYFKNIKQNFDSLQSILPQHVENEMDILSLLVAIYTSKGMSNELEAPDSSQEKTIDKILTQMYHLDKIILATDKFEEYVAAIMKIAEDEEKRAMFIQNVQKSMTTINPFADRKTLKEQYVEMVIRNFYEQMELTVQKNEK